MGHSMSTGESAESEHDCEGAPAGLMWPERRTHVGDGVVGTQLETLVGSYKEGLGVRGDGPC